MITLCDGRRFEKFIEHAVGSAKNPMTDRQLEAKFSGQADGILPPARIRELMDLCWTVEKLPDASRIARAAGVGARRPMADTVMVTLANGRAKSG